MKIWLVLIVLIMLVAVCIFWAYFPWPYLARFLLVDDTLEQADVVVALGGGSERAVHAAELSLNGLAPKIIMTGCGSSAQKMSQLASNKGVDPNDIIIEGKAESTYENALFSREIILMEGYRSAIIVTSPYHTRRTKLVFGRVFRDTNVKLFYSAAPGSGFNVGGRCSTDNDRRLVRREYMKLAYYWLRYWY
ncbi:MAG: YdcF family protein [Desulfotomaculaceae bacterium]